MARTSKFAQLSFPYCSSCNFSSHSRTVLADCAPHALATRWGGPPFRLKMYIGYKLKWFKWGFVQVNSKNVFSYFFPGRGRNCRTFLLRCALVNFHRLLMPCHFRNIDNSHTFFFTKGGPLERPSRRWLGRLFIFGKWTGDANTMDFSDRTEEKLKWQGWCYWNEITIRHSVLLLLLLCYLFWTGGCMIKSNAQALRKKTSMVQWTSTQTQTVAKRNKILTWWVGIFTILLVRCYLIHILLVLQKFLNLWKKQAPLWTSQTGESTGMFVSNMHFKPVDDCAPARCQLTAFVMVIAENTAHAFERLADGHDTASFE